MSSVDVIFFAKVHDPQVLERNEFYAADIRILRDLGHQVKLVTTPWQIPKGDIYFVWWWTWAFFPLLRAKLHKAPIIVVGVFDHVLPDGSLEMFSSRSLLHQWMIRRVLQFADANIFSSQLEFKRLTDEFRIANPSFSYHTVDTNLYRPLSVPKEKFFLSVCWMNAQNPIRKCLPETIQAAALLHEQYPEYQLLICGEQLEGYPPLAQLVSKLGAEDYIKFLGPVSREHKISLMQRCFAYLQPTRVEGFGLAIAEAMACGAPVVTTPVGSIPEVVGDAGAMTEGISPQAIAKATGQILSNPAYAQWLSSEGTARISQMFTYDRRKQNLARVIQRVYDKASSAPTAF